MNFKQIKQTIIDLAKKHNFDPYYFYIGDYSSEYPFIKELEQICGPFENVHLECDKNDTDGDNAFIIEHFTDHNVFIGLNARESSWDSPDVNSFEDVWEAECVPITTMIWQEKEK